jgi:ribosomal protection tetracycline resistance protein
VARARLEIPADRLGAVLAALARLRTAVEAPEPQGLQTVVHAVLPSANLRALQEQLPGLTSGEGVLESSFSGYQPVRGRFPVR